MVTKNRALAFGIIASGSSFGIIIFPIMVERLVQKAGFGWAMKVSASLILFMLILANLTVKSRIPPSPKPVVLMEFVHPLKEIPVLLVCIGCFFFFFRLFLPLSFIIVEARADGMSAQLLGHLLVILNAVGVNISPFLSDLLQSTHFVSIFGRTIPDYISDRIGRFNVVILMSYFSVMVLALWLPGKSNAPIITFAAL